MDIYEPLTKVQLRQIRMEIIDSIFQRIAIRPLNIEQYVRYFHGLSILKVQKDTDEMPAIGENDQYNMAYELWKLDDGSKEKWNHIESIAWYALGKLEP